jgi:hypothetical protein
MIRKVVFIQKKRSDVLFGDFYLRINTNVRPKDEGPTQQNYQKKKNTFDTTVLIDKCTAW